MLDVPRIRIVVFWVYIRVPLFSSYHARAVEYKQLPSRLCANVYDGNIGNPEKSSPFHCPIMWAALAFLAEHAPRARISWPALRTLFDGLQATSYRYGGSSICIYRHTYLAHCIF